MKINFHTIVWMPAKAGRGYKNDKKNRFWGWKRKDGMEGGRRVEYFFTELLNGFLSDFFLEKVGKKYHYCESQKAELRAVAVEMLPFIRREACWERRECCCQGRQLFGGPGENQAKTNDTGYEQVVMSLGSGVDKLQEDYTRKGMLLESYMIEVLAGELLLEGYGAYNRYIRENTNLHVARYHFPGSEERFPLEMLPQMLKDLTIQVNCNEAFCMRPKKSVLFISELTRDEKVSCEGICISCNNVQCPNRVGDSEDMDRLIAKTGDVTLNYGYSRIFGNQRMEGKEYRFSKEDP